MNITKEYLAEVVQLVFDGTPPNMELRAQLIPAILIADAIRDMDNTLAIAVGHLTGKMLT